MEHFSDCIIDSRLPSIKAIQEVIASNPCLRNRSASVENMDQQSNQPTEKPTNQQSWFQQPTEK